MTRATTEWNRNARLAKQRWGRLPRTVLTALRELSEQYRLSVVLGDMLYLNERWYVSHAGLLRIAQRRKCYGIDVECLSVPSIKAAVSIAPLIGEAFVFGFRIVMFICAGLSLASAAIAWLMIPMDSGLATQT